MRVGGPSGPIVGESAPTLLSPTIWERGFRPTHNGPVKDKFGLRATVAAARVLSMLRTRWKPGLLSSLLLASLLVAAQLGAIAHAHTHELGAPQTTVCSICAAANQLGSACINSPVATELASQQSSFHVIVSKDARSSSTLVARQRGPPQAL